MFEDLHWADPSTLEVLDALVRRARQLPLLVALTCRPEFAARWHEHTHFTGVTLGRLSRSQSTNIVSRVTGGKPLPEDLVSLIVEKTDGVPLFLEELTRAVVESQAVQDQGDRYAYRGTFNKMSIPATLHDSLMARLDRLIPVKEIAQIGAAIGREFSYELLRAVSPMPNVQFGEALDKLVRSELVFQRGEPPAASYTFKHALVRDAAYDSLLKTKRQTLHAQIANVLEGPFQHVAAREPELVAHHFTEAALYEQAIPYWLEAGQRALARTALAEAVAQLSTALAVNGSLPSSVAQELQELRIRMLLGTAERMYRVNGV